MNKSIGHLAPIFLTAPQLSAVLAEIRAGLEKIFGERLRELHLFGSRARGDERPDSDIDVAIVLRAYNPNDRVPAEVWKLTHGVWDKTGVCVSLVWFDAAEFATTEETIVENIRAEGRRFR